MREIRLSGLEGGGTDNRFSLPLSKAGYARKMPKLRAAGETPALRQEAIDVA